jgi:hypothetical protein
VGHDTNQLSAFSFSAPIFFGGGVSGPARKTAAVPVTSF